MLSKLFVGNRPALGALLLFLAATVLMLLNLNYAWAADNSPDWSQTEWEDHLTIEMVDNKQVGQTGFSPDGSLVFATPGSDVVVWDSATGDEISRFKHERGTSNAAFSPDGSRLISTGGYRLARTWDVQSGELLHTFGDESHQMRPMIDFVAWPPQGPRAVQRAENWALQVFDAMNSEPVVRLDGINTRTVQLVFSPDGKRIAAAVSDGTVRIFDAESAEQLMVHDRHEGEPEVSFSNDGRRMVSVGRDSAMEVWDTATGEVVQRWEEKFRNSWQSPKFSPDDRRIIVLSKNSWDRFQILDIASGEKVAALPRGESGQPQYNLRFVKFAPDGQSIMTADLQSIRIWYSDNSKGQVSARSETTEFVRELQQLQEQGNLTVRALGAYGMLPEGFMQAALALRGQGMDLLAADREELQDWLNQTEQGQMDLQLHEQDMLKELVSIMTLEGKTASPLDEKREQPAGIWKSPGMHNFGEVGDAEGLRVRAFTPDGRAAVGDMETPEGVRAARWVRGKAPEDLGVLNELSSTSRATGVSDDGRVVVGWDVSLEGEQAFRWVKGQGMQRLEMMDGVEARAETANAHAVNADGSVVVGGVGLRGKMTGYEHQRHVFRWVEGQGMQSLGSLQEGRESVATSVSADGRAIAGWGQTSEGDRAFRWVEGEGMQSLGAFELSDSATEIPSSRGHAISADGSAVVGSSHSADGERAFLWKQDKGLKNLGVLEGADWSRATAVNVDGTVVVGKSGAKKGLDSWTHAFRWSREQGMQDLGIHHGEGSSVARSVSPDGGVVMGERHSEEGKHPVVWVIGAGQEQVKTEEEKASTATEAHKRTSREKAQAEGEKTSKSISESVPKARAQKEYTAQGISFQAPERLIVIADEDGKFYLGDSDMKKYMTDYRFEEPLGLLIFVGLEGKSNLDFLDKDHVRHLEETVMLGNKTFEQYIARETREYEQGEIHATGHILVGRTPSEGGRYLVFNATHAGESSDLGLKKTRKIVETARAVDPDALSDDIPYTAWQDSMLRIRIPGGMFATRNHPGIFHLRTREMPYTSFGVRTGRHALDEFRRVQLLDQEEVSVSRGEFFGYPVVLVEQHVENGFSKRKIFEKCLSGNDPVILTMRVYPQWLKEHGDLSALLDTLEFELPGDAAACPAETLGPVLKHLGLE